MSDTEQTVERCDECGGPLAIVDTDIAVADVVCSVCGATADVRACPRCGSGDDLVVCSDVAEGEESLSRVFVACASCGRRTRTISVLNQAKTGVPHLGTIVGDDDDLDRKLVEYLRRRQEGRDA